MSSKKYRVALVGTGGRANAYTMHGAKEEMELVAVADPNENNRKTFLGLNSIVGLVNEYADWREMFDKEDIDGVVISTPNHLHLEPALAAMEKGYVIALEKPIAESEESCRKLLAAKRKYNARIIVGFVLRSAPFYQKAKEWIRDGRIGDVITIQADEIPHPMTTSVIFRSDWRRFKKSSGGTMMEKCCHDIDLFNWLAAGKPQHISSFGGMKSLKPDPDLPDRCADCKITSECSYYLPPEKYDHPTQINKANDGLLYKFTRDNSQCIYNNGHDLLDHQTVNIEYDNGVLVNFTVDFSAGNKDSGRHLKIIGTKGVIMGKCEDNEIYLRDKLTDEVEKCTIKDDGSGHGGSNRKHTDIFIEMIGNENVFPGASIEAGYVSSMMCVAADEAAESRQVMDISNIIEEAGLKAGFEI